MALLILEEAHDLPRWAARARGPRAAPGCAIRMMTLRGSAAVTSLDLMAAFHPPTCASEPDETGKRHFEHNPGLLGRDAVDCVPVVAVPG
ncbi:hypothetical protein [Streptomyces phaeochromogenes]|uniref:hypothetical protein n=1 Tax=Streptomyces phaeochromogenes TaxID=1923 RepID=UPI00389A9B79